MLEIHFSGCALLCNKCGRHIRSFEHGGRKEMRRLKLKRYYCGPCILARLKPYADKKGCKYVF